MSAGAAGGFIAASVVLRNSGFYKNGALIFESQENGPAFLQAAYEQLGINYPKFYKMDPLSQLGLIATDQLLKDFDLRGFEPNEVALVLSNRNSSVEADAHFLEASHDYVSPALFVYTLPNIVMGEISIRYGLKGESAFFISEHFDARWIQWYVEDLWQHHGIKAAICGWLDVFSDELDGCLFLVKSGSSPTGATFAAEHLNDIYNSKYGK